MTHLFWRAFAAALAASTLLGTAASAQQRPNTKHKINLPPAAELSYSIKAKQKGIPVEGDAVIRWSPSGNKFAITSEVHAMLVGKILETKSEGAIDDYGLAPNSFIEKRFRKDATTTAFNRSAKTISFTGSAQTHPIKGGEQDRSSAIWQLISMARAAPAKFKPGSEWNLVVAGQRDADAWTFKVVNQEKVRTPAGEFNAMHISRKPQADSKDQQLDIWLAPALEWYPVRLRFSDDNGDFIEQTLKQAQKKPT